MPGDRTVRAARWSIAGLILAAGTGPGGWHAPDWARAGERALTAPAELRAGAARDPGPSRKYVLIDLDRNELRFMDGETVLWAAPVGTGTGLYLRDADRGREWEFSTPTGTFRVQRKELDPVWLLPDWYFVRHGRPIPPLHSPERRRPGALGAAAVYLGDEIAIHGTDRPELLGRRVSHGCIRLENKYALRLFHNVQVGTPVVIVGGHEATEDDLPEPTDPGSPRRARSSPLSRVPTDALLQRLDREIIAAHLSSEWTTTASELIARGIRDDAHALRGLLQRAGIRGHRRFDREYATFLADAYARGAARTVVSLARIPEDARERAARAIVEATMDLYHGDLDDAAAPWPSRRLPETRLGPEGRIGWEAIRAAEQEYRQRRRPGGGGPGAARGGLSP